MLRKLLVHVVARLGKGFDDGKWATPVLEIGNSEKLPRESREQPCGESLSPQVSTPADLSKSMIGFACDSCVGCENKLERNDDGERCRIEMSSSDRGVLKAGMMVSLLVCALKHVIEIPWPHYGPTDGFHSLGREALTRLSTLRHRIRAELAQFRARR